MILEKQINLKFSSSFNPSPGWLPVHVANPKFEVTGHTSVVQLKAAPVCDGGRDQMADQDPEMPANNNYF